MTDLGRREWQRSIGPLGRIPGWLAALSAGALLPLAFAPLGWYPLAALSPAILFRLWWAASPGRAFRDGYLYGLGMFGVGISWVYISIHDMGHLSVWLAATITALFIAYLALFPALLGWLAKRWPPAGDTGGDGNHGRWTRLLLVMPAGWVALEALRGRLLTGFPWLYLGDAQSDGPLRGLLPVLGSLGVSWLVALSAACLAGATLASGWRQRLGMAALALAVWILAWPMAGRHWTEPEGQAVRVSLIQSGLPPEVRWSVEDRAKSMEHYLQLTESEWGQDLVVWPESALALFYHEIGPLVEELRQRARDSGTRLLTGVLYLDRDSWRYYNAVVRLSGRPAEPDSFYFKHHLVPFTEYLPLKPALGGLVDFFQVPMSDFSHGAADQAPLNVDGAAVGVTVCYEVAYTGEVGASLPDAELLVNVSNDGWFGHSLGPHQHLQIARVRALETGRWLLRATDSGISALIRPDGSVAQRSGQYRPAVLRGEVQPMTGSTPYVGWGDWPVWVVVLLSLGLAGRARISHSGRKVYQQ
jgi:apolipoprotein N-acyltransferase